MVRTPASWQKAVSIADRGIREELKAMIVSRLSSATHEPHLSGVIWVKEGDGMEPHRGTNGLEALASQQTPSQP